jgi:hypothetical protein
MGRTCLLQRGALGMGILEFGLRFGLGVFRCFPRHLLLLGLLLLHFPFQMALSALYRLWVGRWAVLYVSIHNRDRRGGLDLPSILNNIFPIHSLLLGVQCKMTCSELPAGGRGLAIVVPSQSQVIVLAAALVCCPIVRSFLVLFVVGSFRFGGLPTCHIF